jgi:hypothetical protein
MRILHISLGGFLTLIRYRERMSLEGSFLKGANQKLSASAENASVPALARLEFFL